MKYLIYLFCFISTVETLATPGDKSTLKADTLEGSYASTNLVQNSGFEIGYTRTWLATGGVATITTATANLARGNITAQYTPGGTEGFFSSDLVAIPEGLKGRSVQVDCLVKHGSGSSDVQIQAQDGTVILASASVASSANGFVRAFATFVMPTSGGVRTRIRGVNTVPIYVDDCYIGERKGSLSATASVASVFIKDVKGAGVGGGNFNNNAWRTRDLNTLENPDAYTWVSLSSNQFTLSSGTYIVEAEAPANIVDGHVARLWNATDSTEVAIGSVEYTGSGSTVSTKSKIVKQFTITANKTFEIQHNCQTTNASGTGFGTGANFTPAITNNVFTQVKITRIAD